MIAAVGTDTYGGLTGFKRPLAGNPTRVPSNLPAFRGVNNKPGSNIKAPAVKSSASHPDRKTNVCIPYARMSPLDITADSGRMNSGDVVFCSKTRPGVPGYATARFSRLCGIDGLNGWMGPHYWTNKIENGRTFRSILVDAVNVADEWRKVPILGEWAVDGIVLSNEDKELFYNNSHGKSEGHLYNIAIQGPCMVNNGYVEESERIGDLSRRSQGQVARQTQLFAPGYMDHRVERFGKDKTTVSQEFDFAADYRGPQYHLYPLQMFSREIRPMQHLYVGLVATEYKYDGAARAIVENYIALKADLEEIVEAMKDPEGSVRDSGQAVTPATVASFKALAQPNLEAAGQALDAFTTANYEALRLALRSKTAYEKMGWMWDSAAGAFSTNSLGDPPPKKNFYSFRYALFTSGQAWDMDNEVDIMAPDGVPKIRSKRQRSGANDPYDDDKMRMRDMKNMIGAWHVGQVLDMKAGKMPYTEGGPVETGYRLTADVHVGWCDYRALRHKYSPADAAAQFGQNHVAQWTTAFLSTQRWRDDQKIFLWPTTFSSDSYTRPTAGTVDATKAAYKSQSAPINPQNFYDGKDIDLQERADYFADFEGRGLPSQEPDEGFQPGEGDSTVLFEALIGRRLPRVQPLPVVEGRGADRVASLSRRAATAAANLKMLFAPDSPEERAGQAPAVVASFVVSAPTSASAAGSSSANASLRRRSGNTPDPSPDRSGTVGAIGAQAGSVSPSCIAAPSAPSAPSGASGSGSLAPVIEAPAAPVAAGAAGAASRRRSAGAASGDVFSSIFGSDAAAGASAAPQPLNPAHREGGSGATGRSFQRRGKGSK